MTISVDHARPEGSVGGRPRRPAISLVADNAVPLGLYYGLRAAGLGIYLTLIIAAAVPAALAADRLARWRRIDGLAVYVLTTMLLSTVVSLIAGSPRFLLAREGWLTAVTGLWFIGSVWVERPLTFHYGRAFLEQRTARLGVAWTWDEIWERSPRFRRIWRTGSVLWGVGLLADAAVRVLMAYTLPIDSVPALGTALYVVTSVVLSLLTGAYYHRAGLFDRTSALYAPLADLERLRTVPMPTSTRSDGAGVHPRA